MACSVDQTALGSKRKVISRELGGHRSVDFEFVIEGKHSGLDLMGREAVIAFGLVNVRQDLVDGSSFTRARMRIGIAEEAIGGEGYAVAEASSENFAHGNIPCLAKEIEAGEFQGSQDLGTVVVERCCGIGDEEAHLFKARGVVPDEVRLHGAEDRFSGFASATHFSKADEAVVRFNFDDGADEASPMAAVGMTQRSLQRDGDGGGTNIDDFHRQTVSCYMEQE